MKYYLSEIYQDGTVIEKSEHSGLNVTIKTLSNGYLKEPESLFSMNADCRINEKGNITRIFVSSESHDFKEGYEKIKAIQIASTKEISMKYEKRTLGDDFKPVGDLDKSVTLNILTKQ